MLIGRAMAGIMNHRSTAVNLHRWAIAQSAHTQTHRPNDGDFANRHHNQQAATIAVVVPRSVVASEPWARMLGLKQYIAQAASPLRAPYRSLAHRQVTHPPANDSGIRPKRASRRSSANRSKFA